MSTTGAHPIGLVLNDDPIELRARLAASERAADRLLRLQSVTALLSGAKTREDVCTVVVHQGMAGVGAQYGVLCLLTNDGTELEIAQAVGLHPATAENWGRFPADAPVPACDAIRTGELILFSSLEERDRMYPGLVGQPSHHQAFATMPLRLTGQAGRAFGSVTFGWPDPREFTTEDRRFLVALSEQCSQALDRCRLYEAEARERQRKEFIAEAGALLASSLDYETTIERVARLLLPRLADTCAVHVVDGDRLSMVTMAHVNPEHERILRALGDKGDRIARHFKLVDVARSGEPLVVSEIRQTKWDEMAADDDERTKLHLLGLRSGLAVPLIASGQCLGVLSLAMSVSGRSYGPEDVTTARELADRAAVAIHNARSHRALRDVAMTLQRSLLPADRPVIPGLDVAAVYHPVSDSQVGGDFYDVFPVGSGRWGLVVGDVCGKGVQAAALTALARYTVRAVAVDADSPSAVLRRLNQAVLDETSDERFCTVAHAFLEPGDGSVTLRLSCAGHPLPVLVSSDGDVRAVGRPGTGIGLVTEPDLVDTVHTLSPGQALVLFTDGVIEARSPDGQFDPGLFERALRSAASGDAAAMAAAVEDAVLAFQGGAARDDMAVLVVRMPALPSSRGQA